MEMMRNDVDEMSRSRDEMSLRHVHVQDEMRQDEMSPEDEARWGVRGDGDEMGYRWYEM